MFSTIKKNESDLDRSIRTVVSTGIIIYALLTQVWWLLLVGIPLFITGAIGFCGVYSLLGISTCPVEVKSTAKMAAKSVAKPVAKPKKVAKQKVAKKSKAKLVTSKTSRSKSKKK